MWTSKFISRKKKANKQNPNQNKQKIEPNQTNKAKKKTPNKQTNPKQARVYISERDVFSIKIIQILNYLF